ncbi:putative phytosulfokines 6 [Durio zibethinus]|uniref:Phytosulfokine n=1 Tax=Durio zibethinus TaxID=66656 RepID=A0A6P5YSW6_DURZI|nr:putative phytosulfokines 6 [Durio zibethinus]
MNMKRKIVGFITFLLFAFLLCSYSTPARLLPQKQGEKQFKANGMIQAGLFTDAKEDFSNLMGSSEECYEKDEECLKRRMIAEAHLDYIYTQHHKP